MVVIVVMMVIIGIVVMITFPGTVAHGYNLLITYLQKMHFNGINYSTYVLVPL